MVVYSSLPVSLHSLVLRMLPVRNEDPADRIRAWNEWLSFGGSDPVLKFIRWSNGTTTDDEEILQETLILGYLKVERREYQDRNLPFTAFLKKIAWYKIMEASRKHAGQVPLDDFYEVLAEEGEEHEVAEHWKEHEALHQALAQLPPRRARVMVLYEDGYSTAEIAQHLGIKEELVRKEKSLGLRQLRDAMRHVALAG
ncbi:MAG: sigma-70 family RNA polymerase sigma factor [Chloroflexi bacterium]|nr:sigma-70 family RNA polymerase sigma factor [Chloroflexota bacterium]